MTTAAAETTAAPTVRLGRAQRSGPLTVFPLIATVAPSLDYRSYAEAAAQGFVVRELREGASVNDLEVLNPLDVPVMLFEGEEVAGAQQDRTLDVSVLVGAGSRLQVPVSCVEAGRWDGSRSHEAFAPAPQAAYPSLRALKASHAAQAIAVGAEARADQSAVWSEVGEKAARRRVDSSTGAMRDVFAGDAGAIDAVGAPIRRRPGQVGALVTINGEVAVMDLVSRSDVWAALHGPLVRGYALDAVDRGDDDPAPARREVARDFVRTVLSAPRTPHRAVGLGTGVRVDARVATASGLEDDGELVQLSAFPRERRGSSEARRVRRPSRRR